jgi:paraquat-inducible protein A
MRVGGARDGLCSGAPAVRLALREKCEEWGRLAELCVTYSAAANREGPLIDMGCPNCGALQTLSLESGATVASCGVCRSVLERTNGRSLDGALACSAATLLLLLPANLLPFLTTSAIGVSRQSVLGSGAVAMWADGWPWLAMAIGLFVVAFPLARFALLTAVLGALRLGAAPPWLGQAFRWANNLEQWAMADVFLLALWVAYARLAGTITVQLGMGAICFIAAGVLSMVTRAALNRAAVWRRIASDASLAPGVAACSCLACDVIAPASAAGGPCPRCGARLSTRETDSIARTVALAGAGVLLYIPANIFAIATIPIGLHPTQYNILQGVIDLFKAGLYGLAALVFCASFTIPFLKLLGLGYCLLSVFRRSDRRLVLKTRVYRIVEEIGRWSMVDPFVIACFVPVMRYNSFIYGRAEPAAPAFAAVVILTMIAARTFDPRLMWDAAGQRAFSRSPA